MTRDVRAIRTDIEDLERLLVDMPPHHAGGTRRGVSERLDDLRAELRRVEAAATAERPSVDGRGAR